MFEFKVDDVNRIDIDWKSPLQLKINDVCEEAGRAAAKAFDDMVFDAVAEVGIKVDRDELIKALEYDRGQYEKGYGDGYRAAKDEIVQCKDCMHSRPIDREDSYEAFFGEDCVWCTENDVGMHNHGFCSKGERKDDAENH